MHSLMYFLGKCSTSIWLIRTLLRHLRRQTLDDIADHCGLPVEES